MKFTKYVVRLGLAAAVLGTTSTAAVAQQVSLTIRDGRVTLKSENATARQILDEWARLGQTRVVNADKITGPPLSLTLIDVPERQALDVVLRSAAGYAVSERATATANASVFERILVMARTTPVTQVAAAAAAPAPAVYQPTAANDETIVMTDEPPQPTAPVVNPYGNNGLANNAASAGGSNGTVNVRPPETQFDYTNPQAYFEAQRRAQQAAQGGQGAQQPAATFNPYPGSSVAPVSLSGAGTGAQQQPTQPSNVPTFSGTSSQPGAAPTPTPSTAPPPNQGQFNPYNMNPYNMPPSTPSTSSGEQPRYVNPYNLPPSQQKPPNE